MINSPKINAKENCENVNALSRKLHFCENCYIWGKAIAGTAKIFPSIVIYSVSVGYTAQRSQVGARRVGLGVRVKCLLSPVLGG